MITNPTEQYFGSGLWGFDGSQWRKLNLLFGYHDRYAEEVSSAGVAAGTNILTGSVVPSGEIWVVSTCTGYDSVSAINRIWFSVYDAANDFYIGGKSSPAQKELVLFTGWVVLKPGDCIRTTFYGCIEDDNLFTFYTGFKQQIS